MKKIFLILCFALCTFALTARADELYIGENTDINNGIIEIVGKTSEAENNRFATIILVNEATDIDEVTNGTVEPLCVETAEIDYDGNFKVEFNYGFAGSYVIYAFSPETMLHIQYRYATVEELTNLFDDIRTGALSGSAIFAAVDEYSDSLGIRTDSYDNIKYKKLFSERIAEKKDAFTELSVSITTIKTIDENVKKEIELLKQITTANNYLLISDIIDELSKLTGVKFSYGNKAENSVNSELVGKTFYSSEEVAAQIKKIASKNNTVLRGGGSSGGTGGSGTSFGNLNTSQNNELEITDVFDDLQGFDWAKPSIHELAKKGIINGDGTGRFNPNNNVKREEFVKILSITFNLNTENCQCSFDDVAKSAWYYSYIAAANESGVINGISETEFGVGMNIRREDMFVMIYNFMKKENLITTEEKPLEFSDNDEIADYAADAVKSLYGMGIVNGVGANRLAPKDSATRAQAAKLVHSVLEKINLITDKEEV